MTVATDIICGFPFETKEDFDQTLQLVDKYRFPVLNISQFYPRPGTVALKWKRVDTREVKNRSTAITKLFTSYTNYENLKGTIQRIWIHENTDDSKYEGESFMVGHNKCYVKVLVNRDTSLIGHQVIVKVTDIHKWHVYGEVIDRNPKCINVNFYDHFKGMYIEPNKEIKGNEVKYKEQINIHELIDTFDMKAKKADKFNNEHEQKEHNSKSNADTNKNTFSPTSQVSQKDNKSNLPLNLLVTAFYLVAIIFMTFGLKDLNIDLISFIKTATIS